ncbi:MAG: type II toxin-antitoxin system RelE/ParE family toxin [Ignavibacteria bacterium]|nr:type II toxin-antitoxin system RelE/ParE family toxin [Ignavibacteria bacterium]
MYSIRFSKSVKKFLKELDNKTFSTFVEKINILQQDPYKRDNNLDIKPLVNLPKGNYRLRISNYRFLYEIKEKEIIIFFYKAGTRQSIYK